jgi:hypothetical protein
LAPVYKVALTEMGKLVLAVTRVSAAARWTAKTSARSPVSSGVAFATSDNHTAHEFVA